MRIKLFTLTLISFTLAQPDNATLTLYKDGTALIKQPVAWSIPSGKSYVTWGNLPNGIHKDTPFLNLDGANIISQRFNDNLFTEIDYFSKLKGEEILVKPKDGKVVKGKLLEISSATVTIYNAAESNINLAGVTIMTSTANDQTCASLSGTLNAGASTTATCTVTADGMLYLADRDGDNNGGNEGSPDSKFYGIDGVCWNDGSGTDTSCDSSTDAVVAAGLWAEDTYVHDVDNEGIRLDSPGNNDDGLSDWEKIPEFGTLLMPIASVLLIVGYNYRKKQTED